MTALLLVPSISSAAIDSSRVANCEAKWSQIASQTGAESRPADKRGILNSWLALDSECHGTGAYEFRLATLYVSLDQPAKAIPLLTNTASWPGDLARLAPFVRLDAQMKVYLAEAPFPREKFNALRPQFMAALAEAPNIAMANAQTAHYLMMIGDDAAASTRAARALELDPNQVDAVRTLTIAQAGLGQFAAAIASGVRATQLSAGLTSDPYFMYAWAKAYAATGNVKMAEQLLGVLVGEVPAARGTDEWKGTIEFIREQIRAGAAKK